MKDKWILLSICLLIVSSLSACDGSGSGPQSWIDYPLEENNPVPLEPITLHAHASDLDGVSSIEFSVDETVFHTYNTGGSRLGEALVEWVPPSPGRYWISVKATDNNGNIGAASSVEVVILGEEELAALDLPDELEPHQGYQPGEIVETEPPPEPEPEELVDQDPEGEEEQSEQPEDEPIAIAKQNTYCRKGPGTNYQAVTIINEGEDAPIVGKSQDNTWLILLPSGQSVNCWFAAYLATIQGDISALPIFQPPPPPDEGPDAPEEEPEEEEEPPVPDTTPPDIMSTSINPSKIYRLDCSGEVTTALSTIKAQDAGGIAHFSAAWSIGSESGEVSYQSVGGATYQATFGPVNTAGTMEIYGSVVDNAGNWTPFTLSLAVSHCPIE